MLLLYFTLSNLFYFFFLFDGQVVVCKGGVRQWWWWWETMIFFLNCSLYGYFFLMMMIIIFLPMVVSILGIYIWSGIHMQKKRKKMQKKNREKYRSIDHARLHCAEFCPKASLCLAKKCRARHSLHSIAYHNR